MSDRCLRHPKIILLGHPWDRLVLCGVSVHLERTITMAEALLRLDLFTLRSSPLLSQRLPEKTYSTSRSLDVANVPSSQREHPVGLTARRARSAKKFLYCGLANSR